MRQVLYYFTDVDLSIDDGPGINEREFVNAFLAAEGFEKLCFVPTPANREKLPQSESWRFVPRRSGGLIDYLRFYSGVARAARREARTLRPSGLVVRPTVITAVPLMLTRLVGAPLILKTLAGYSMFEAKQKSLLKGLFAKVSLPFFKRMVKEAVFADAPSGSYAVWQRDRFGISEEKLAVVPNGVNAEVFKPMPRADARAVTGLPLGPKIVGYVGALAVLRHLDRLIPAVEELSRRHRPGSFMIVFVGQGRDAEALKAEVSRRGLDGYFRFAGKVAYETVPAWMSSFDAALDLTLVDMRLRDGSILKCSFSQKIPQYLACARPVVALDCEDNEYLRSQRVGWLVPEERAEAGLAEAIERIILMPEDEWETWSRRSLTYVLGARTIQQLVRERAKHWRTVLGWDEESAA